MRNTHRWSHYHRYIAAQIKACKYRRSNMAVYAAYATWRLCCLIHRGTDVWGNQPLPHVDFTPLYTAQHKTFTCPQEGSFNLGMFLGMLTADGHVTTSNYVVGITKNCPEVLERFTALLEALFGLHGRKLIDPRNGVTSIVVGSKSLQEWLRGIGFSKQQVPDCVLTGSRDMALGYLSRLYLDGWITRSQVGISQKSRSLPSRCPGTVGITWECRPTLPPIL